MLAAVLGSHREAPVFLRLVENRKQLGSGIDHHGRCSPCSLSRTTEPRDCSKRKPLAVDHLAVLCGRHVNAGPVFATVLHGLEAQAGAVQVPVLRSLLRRHLQKSVSEFHCASRFNFRRPQCVSFRDALNTRSAFRFNARMMPIRVNIGDPSCSATQQQRLDRFLPFLGIVFCLGQLGDVFRGVAECDQRFPALQNDRIEEPLLPRHRLRRAAMSVDNPDRDACRRMPQSTRAGHHRQDRDGA